MPIRWKLKELAARKKLTGYQIAALTGISAQTIYKLMRKPNVTRVNETTIDILCDKLKVTRRQLLEVAKQ